MSNFCAERGIDETRTKLTYSQLWDHVSFRTRRKVLNRSVVGSVVVL